PRSTLSPYTTLFRSHANDGQPTGTRVHMDAIRDQPTATDIKHHPGETSMVMLRSAAAATSASLAAWLLGGWALRLAGRGLLRVDEVVALVAAGGGAVVARR